MWLTPNNVGKMSSDPGYNKLIYFPGDSTATPAAPAGADPVAAGAVTIPGAGGTWTNLVAGTTSLDTAFAAAGRIDVQFRSTAGRIPWLLAT